MIAFVGREAEDAVIVDCSFGVMADKPEVFTSLWEAQLARMLERSRAETTEFKSSQTLMLGD